MSKRPVELLLQDILDAVNKIERYTKRISEGTFIKDEMRIDAVARNLEIIGEAANQLPEDFRASHPEIEWNKIVGLRHRIIHAYFGIDLKIIWQILKSDMPLFKKNIKRFCGKRR
ncbi:MAG: hypothetical protein A2283_03925 [Lentisphaerae bacterium RIFOXYA12_FULL_48_11]|nr:MAG: hypothetical protein A2283_03925 [Lentisphaerae bacterium RIFOXYA12_FULL_48_11]